MDAKAGRKVSEANGAFDVEPGPEFRRQRNLSLYAGKNLCYSSKGLYAMGEKDMWADRIEQTKQMRRTHLEGGGPERIRKQREKGKMTALERIEYLLDDGSFHPVDSFFQTR